MTDIPNDPYEKFLTDIVDVLIPVKVWVNNNP